MKSLRETEHESMVAIIEELVQCHRRKAYVDLGFQTMWAYISQFLEYAPAAASRRYRAMQCVDLCSEALDLLREKRVSLTVLSKCWARLKSAEDPRAFLAKIDGKSQREVERILASYAPAQVLPPERAKPRFVKVGAGDALAARLAGHSATESSAAELSTGHPQVPGLFDTVGASSTVEHGPSKGSAAELGGPSERSSAAELSSAPGSDSPTDEQTVELVEYTFCVPRGLHDQLLKAQAIVSRATGGCPTMFETLEAMTRFFLQHKSPVERKRRREERRRSQKKRTSASRTGGARAGAPRSSERQPSRARTEAKGAGETAGDTAGEVVGEVADEATEGAKQQETGVASASGIDTVPRSRHIPQATRDLVFARDGERCTYVGPDGHRCRATHDLQIDHVVPFAHGGSHDPENLRVLCGTHNRRRNDEGGTSVVRERGWSCAYRTRARLRRAVDPVDPMDPRSTGNPPGP